MQLASVSVLMVLWRLPESAVRDVKTMGTLMDKFVHAFPATPDHKPGKNASPSLDAPSPMKFYQELIHVSASPDTRELASSARR